MNNIIENRTKPGVVIRNFINVMTVVSYIVFSMIKRLSENDKLYWIPFILVCANLAIIAEQVYSLYNKKELMERRTLILIIGQSLLNIALGILIFTYLRN